MCRKGIEKHDFPSAGFIQDRHFHAIAERAFTINQQGIYITYIGIFAYFIISYVILHPLNTAIIPYRNIMQDGMTNAGMTDNSTGQSKRIFKNPQVYRSGKTDVNHVIRHERRSHPDQIPVGSPTTLRFKAGDFGSCK